MRFREERLSQRIMGTGSFNNLFNNLRAVLFHKVEARAQYNSPTSSTKCSKHKKKSLIERGNHHERKSRIHWTRDHG